MNYSTNFIYNIPEINQIITGYKDELERYDKLKEGKVKYTKQFTYYRKEYNLDIRRKNDKYYLYINDILIGTRPNSDFMNGFYSFIQDKLREFYDNNGFSFEEDQNEFIESTMLITKILSDIGRRKEDKYISNKRKKESDFKYMTRQLFITQRFHH